MGIAQLIADDDEGSLSPGGGFFQNVVDGVVGVGGDQGDDTLMGPGGGHLVQLPAVHGNHHGTGFLGFCGKPLQTPVGVTHGHKDLVDGPAYLQGFLQGVAALDLALYFFCRRCPVSEAVGTAGGILPAAVIVTSVGTAFFVHIHSTPDHEFMPCRAGEFRNIRICTAHTYR